MHCKLLGIGLIRWLISIVSWSFRSINLIIGIILSIQDPLGLVIPEVNDWLGYSRCL